MKLSFLLLLMALVPPGFTFAQQPISTQEDPARSRAIMSDAFIRNRPSADGSEKADKASSVPATSGQQREPHKFVRTEPAPRGGGRSNTSTSDPDPSVIVVGGRVASTEKESNGKTPGKVAKSRPVKSKAAKPQPAQPKSVSSSVAEEQVGITMWRLRKSESGGVGPGISVLSDSGTTEMWRAERASSDTRFTRGDRVRLSIESPREGYLYVIDREQYSDGTLGDAMMIFPTTRTRSGDNHVKAGILVEIPDQQEQYPYFILKSDNIRYMGELLTVIISPTPITGLAIGDKPLPISRTRIQEWEQTWGSQTEVFEQQGGEGRAYTVAEKEAGNGLKTRQLTREDPVPQTILRVKVPVGETILVPVRIQLG